MQRWPILALACAFAVGAVAGPRPVGAQTVHCFIQPTADGFVALRAGRSAESRLIARMRPGDEIMVINDQPNARIWVEIRYAPGRVAYDELARTAPGRIQQGFVHRRFLVNCDV